MRLIVFLKLSLLVFLKVVLKKINFLCQPTIKMHDNDIYMRIFKQKKSGYWPMKSYRHYFNHKENVT